MTATTLTLTVHDHPTTVHRGGDGPPLLLLHGEGNTSAWGPLHDLLAEDFEVIAPVHPGFGGEDDVPPWLHDLSDISFHYIDLIGQLELDRPPLLVGVSLGGWMALDLAIHRSDLLAGLLVIGALGLRPSEPMPDLFLSSGPEALDYLAETMDGSEVDPLTGDVEAATALWVEQATQARLMWERPYDRRLPRRAHHISCPTAVLWGGADRLLPVEHGRRLAELLSAPLEVVAGAGHLVTIDDPTAVATAVRRLASDPGSQAQETS